MKTHNAIIYHCLNCGNVQHREMDEAVPICCDRTMARAAIETVNEQAAAEVPEAADDLPPSKPPQLPR